MKNFLILLGVFVAAEIVNRVAISPWGVVFGACLAFQVGVFSRRLERQEEKQAAGHVVTTGAFLAGAFAARAPLDVWGTAFGVLAALLVGIVGCRLLRDPVTSGGAGGKGT